MKLLTFSNDPARTGRFGVLLSDNRVLDVTAVGGDLPRTLLECIQGGDAALARVRAATREAEAKLARNEKAANVVDLKSVKLEAPLRPGKIMAMGKN
jgi:hypothetical protein